MKKLFTKHPFTSIGGLVIIALFAVDVYRNGVHTDNLALLTTGVVLLKAADAKTAPKEEETPTEE